MSTIIDLAEDRQGALDTAAETLQNGSAVVLPVGGVYAVVADAFRPAATQRIFAARRRSRSTPLPVLLRSERQVGAMARDVPDYADRLMAAYWPGDLTLVLPASQTLEWDLGNGKGTVQLRLPDDDFVTELIGMVGSLACTAANRLSQPRPTTMEAAKSQLGILVPVYLDGGQLDGEVSTIVDGTGPSAVVHREGRIAAEHVHLVADGEVPWGERPTTPVPAKPVGEETAPDEEDRGVGEVTAEEAVEEAREAIEEARQVIEHVEDPADPDPADPEPADPESADGDGAPPV